MKLFRIIPTMLVALVATVQTPVFAQAWLSFNAVTITPRGKEVMQDNEITPGAKAVGSFYNNPLMINTRPLDYNGFSIESKGELTVIKGDAATGRPERIPFYLYLRRNGMIIERPKIKYYNTEISDILKESRVGDYLIIEPANAEDWQAKRILKILKGGC